VAIQEFRDWLVTQNTSPLIISQFCCGLNQWRETGQVTPLLEDNQLLIQQNMIGWNGVLEGCFSVSWADAQQAYYQQIQSKRTGSKWQVATCRRIWMIPWAMWEHRNSIEHASDLQKETEIVDTQIQEELNKGSGNNADIEQMQQQGRLFEEERRSLLAYKKSWLRGIRTVRERAQRKGLAGNILRGMRANMRRFLRGGN
jgi:hypothetical protein